MLGVFPAASKQHIPKCFHHLMESEDSPVIDFYPLDFEIDLNGKKYEWQGVALLPFIDADRLLSAVEPLYKRLSKDEARRNSMGHDCLMVATQNKVFETLCSVYSVKATEVNQFNKKIPLNSLKSQGMEGTIMKDPEVCFPGSNYPSPLKEFGLEDVDNRVSVRFSELTLVLCMFYQR